MDSKDYDQLTQLTDRELFDFVTEKEASQRKWVAIHLLEMRRNRAIVSAAQSSAAAAWVAAVVAGISAIFAALVYFHVLPQ